MDRVASAVDVMLRLFALGLFIRAVLTWVRITSLQKVERYLDQIYAPFVTPLRRVIKPIPLKTTPATALDVTPLILLLAVWWVVHPFAMWLLR